MRKSSIVVGGIVIALAFFWVGDLHNEAKRQIESPLGSTPITGEYHSTAINTGSNVGGVLVNYPGTLGSIIVPTNLSGGVKVFNATTTDVTQRASATSSLTVVGFLDAGTTPGTYTFDAIGTVGLVYEFSTISSSTITWR